MQSEEVVSGMDGIAAERHSHGRRRFIRAVGVGAVGLLVGTNAAGLGAADPDYAGSHRLTVSAPSCESIVLYYENGKSPLTVYVLDSSGRRYAVVELTNDKRREQLTGVSAGTYTVEAKPGDEYDDGDTDNEAVEVTGSPVSVEACCPTYDDLVVTFECWESGYLGEVYATNPNPVAVNLFRLFTLSDGRRIGSVITLRPNATRVEAGTLGPGSSVLMTAQAQDDCNTRVLINGESTYTHTQRTACSA